MLDFNVVTLNPSFDVKHDGRRKARVVAEEKPNEVMEECGIDHPDYYLGAEYGRVQGNFTERGVTSTWSANGENLQEELGKISADMCTKALNGPRLHNYIKKLIQHDRLNSGECQE